MRNTNEPKILSEIFKKLKEKGAIEITFDFERDDVEIIYKRGNRCWSVYGENIGVAVKKFMHCVEFEE